MSTASKITFGLTTIGTIATVLFVHDLQKEERESLHQGPIRDQERVRMKREAENAALAAAKDQPVQLTLTETQKARAAEYELQKELRDQYSKVQQVSKGPQTAEQVVSSDNNTN